LRAVRDARTRALATGPGATYAWLGVYFVGVYVILGETALALDELEVLLKTPYAASPHYLRLEPILKPLRGHARFQKLLAEHLPQD